MNLDFDIFCVKKNVYIKNIKKKMVRVSFEIDKFNF